MARSKARSGQGWRAVWLALVLVLAQTLALGHAAHYGFQPHEHKGKACEFSLGAERQAALDLAEPPVLPVPAPVRGAAPRPAVAYAVAAAAPKPLPRGPPPTEAA